MLSAALTIRITELVTGGDPGLSTGAELAVRSASGELAFRAPLARHWREEVGERCIWVRPIAGGYEPTERRPGDPPYLFSLNAARRRGLTWTTASVKGETVVLELAGGEVATIGPAGEDLRPELERWDSFVLQLLPSELEQELEQLEDDSWQGQHA